MAFISGHGPRIEQRGRGLLGFVLRMLFLGSILALLPLLTAVAWLAVAAGADLTLAVGFFLSFWAMTVATLGCLVYVTREESVIGEEYDLRGIHPIRQRASSR
jgi:hypothetical protein